MIGGLYQYYSSSRVGPEVIDILISIEAQLFAKQSRAPAWILIAEGVNCAWLLGEGKLQWLARSAFKDHFVRI